MVAKGTKRVGNYPPAKYRYFDGNTKHPYEWKACPTCRQESWLQTRQTYCSYQCSKTGALNPKWKAAEAGYVSLHARVYRARGKAERCERCGADGPGRYEWANLTGHYDDVADFASMCKPCHARYDFGRRPSGGRRVFTDELLARAEQMCQTMTIKAAAHELGVSYVNLTQYLRRRRLAQAA